MNLPELNKSSSHPPTTSINKQRKKARFGIFLKRNSLDRDVVIHQNHHNARKKANTMIKYHK